jgi:hypothetical protein
MGAMMELTVYSLFGALLLLVFGVALLVGVQKSLYPALRWRFEQAKTTQTQGVDPARIMLLLRVLALVIMPLAGLMLGGPIKSMFGETP